MVDHCLGFGFGLFWNRKKEVSSVLTGGGECIYVGMYVCMYVWDFGEGGHPVGM